MGHYKCCNFCNRRNPYWGCYDQSSNANKSIPKPEQDAISAVLYDTVPSINNSNQKNVDEIGIHIVTPGTFTISSPVVKGDEYQLAVLNMDISQCGKRITELNFACNLDIKNTPLDISIQIFKMWDFRHTWIPLTAPIRIVKQYIIGIANCICFHVYDTEQIHCQCFSYLALLRFLRPISEEGSLTVQNSIMTAITQQTTSRI